MLSTICTQINPRAEWFYMDNCIFCKIIAREIPAEVIYENDQVLAFLDIAPVSEGHTLVIPKRHARNLTDGTVEDAKSMITAVHEIAPKMLRALGATAYNLGMNHGEDAGQDVFHTHMHIMPRYVGVPRSFTQMHPNAETIRAVAEKIRVTF